MNKPLRKASLHAVAGVCAALLLSTGTAALAATDCLTSVSFSNASPRVDYDPFNVSPQTSPTFSLTVSRVSRGQSAPRVTSVDIQFVDLDSNEGNASIGSVGLNNVEIVGGGAQLLRGSTPNFSAGKFLTIDFTGTASNATSSLMRLRIPGSNDAHAGVYRESVDLAYRCNLTDGTTSTWTRSGALTLVGDVANLVRAVAVGGGTSASLFLNPSTLQATGALAVRSTGAYSVSATSENNFKLRANGAGRNPPPDQEIDYEFLVDGEMLNAPNAERRCPRSGIGGTNLTVQSRIRGSVAALRSGQYSDVVTITVTPESFSPVVCR